MPKRQEARVASSLPHRLLLRLPRRSRDGERQKAKRDELNQLKLCSSRTSHLLSLRPYASSSCFLLISWVITFHEIFSHAFVSIWNCELVLSPLGLTFRSFVDFMVSLSFLRAINPNILLLLRTDTQRYRSAIRVDLCASSCSALRFVNSARVFTRNSLDSPAFGGKC